MPRCAGRPACRHWVSIGPPETGAGTLLCITLGCCPWQRRAIIGQAMRATVLRLDGLKFGSERPRPLLQALVLRGLLLRRLCALIARALFVTQRHDTVAVSSRGGGIHALEPDRRIDSVVGQGAGRRISSAGLVASARLHAARAARGSDLLGHRRAALRKPRLRAGFA